MNRTGCHPAIYAFGPKPGQQVLTGACELGRCARAARDDSGTAHLLAITATLRYMVGLKKPKLAMREPSAAEPCSLCTRAGVPAPLAHASSPDDDTRIAAPHDI